MCFVPDTHRVRRLPERPIRPEPFRRRDYQPRFDNAWHLDCRRLKQAGLPSALIHILRLPVKNRVSVTRVVNTQPGKPITVRRHLSECSYFGDIHECVPHGRLTRPRYLDQACVGLRVVSPGGRQSCRERASWRSPGSAPPQRRRRGQVTPQRSLLGWCRLRWHHHDSADAAARWRRLPRRRGRRCRPP